MSKPAMGLTDIETGLNPGMETEQKAFCYHTEYGSFLVALVSGTRYLHIESPSVRQLVSSPSDRGFQECSGLIAVGTSIKEGVNPICGHRDLSGHPAYQYYLLKCATGVQCL